MSEGNKKLSYKQVSGKLEKQVCDHNAHFLFSLFSGVGKHGTDGELKSANTISFLDFLVGCSLFSRGSLEERLGFLFRGMRVKGEKFADRSSVQAFLRMICEENFAESEQRNFLEMVFEAEKNPMKISGRRFVVKVIPKAEKYPFLHFFDRFFAPLVLDMEKIIGMSTSSVFRLDECSDSEVPAFLPIVCTSIEKKLAHVIDENEYKTLLFSKMDKNMLETFVSCFSLGYVDLDFDDYDLIFMIHLLRELLKQFSVPIFTYSLSEEACVPQIYTRNLFNRSYSLLCSLPTINYEVTKLVLSTVKKACLGYEFLFNYYSSFFVECFFRFREEFAPEVSDNASSIFVYILKNYDKVQRRPEKANVVMNKQFF